MTTSRRKFSPEFKARVVLELLIGTKGLMQTSREYGIKDTVISRWKQEFLERTPEIFKQNNWQNEQEAQQRIIELERLVGRLTLELDMAKKVFGYSGSANRASD